MKKLLFKAILLVAVLLALPYYLLGGGNMPGFLKNIMPEKTATEAKLPKNISNVVTDKEVTYYKWVDDQGHTHFSNTPPTGQQAEKKTLRPDTNIVKAVKVPEKEEESGGGLFNLGNSDKKKGDDDVDPTKLENPYSPEGISNLMKKAEKAKEMMNARNKELGKIVGDGAGQ